MPIKNGGMSNINAPPKNFFQPDPTVRSIIYYLHHAPSPDLALEIELPVKARWLVLPTKMQEITLPVRRQFRMKTPLGAFD